MQINTGLLKILLYVNCIYIYTFLFSYISNSLFYFDSFFRTLENFTKQISFESNVEVIDLAASLLDSSRNGKRQPVCQAVVASFVTDFVLPSGGNCIELNRIWHNVCRVSNFISRPNDVSYKFYKLLVHGIDCDNFLSQFLCVFMNLQQQYLTECCIFLVFLDNTQQNVKTIK